MMDDIKAVIEQGDALFFRQADRDGALRLDPDDPTIHVFRKRARIVAVRIPQPFAVETDRGIMQAKAGDWLATNHPDDDPGSDMWALSDERMRATYEEVP